MKKDVFGEALLDYFNGNYSEDITVHSSITEDDSIPIPYLFRTYEEMPALEQEALQLAKGKILDVGCCAGSHSLYLQESGKIVIALDVSPAAVKVAQKRGVKQTICKAILDLNNEKFDTILLLMNGAGIFEKLSLAPKYLTHLATLLHPQGQIILDSSNIAYMFEEEDGSYWRDATKDYYGEVKFQISYKNTTSASFDWLFLDYNTLEKLAKKSGFSCEKISQGSHFDYLARLTKK